MLVGRGLVSVCAAAGVVLAGVLVPSGVAVAQPSADSPGVGRSVPVDGLGAVPEGLPVMPRWEPDAVVWPVPGSAVVEVPEPGLVRERSAVVSVGGLPVRVAAAGEAPGRVRVEVLDRSAGARVGAAVVVRLSRADGRSGVGRVRVELDASSFRAAFGADWLWRLGLVQLPGCAVAPPGLAGCAGWERLDSTVDGGAGLVSAVVELPGDARAAAAGGGDVLVGLVTTGASTETGDFTKSDLKASASWSAGGSSGDFTWSYPIGVPPVPGGLTPQVALSYSSGAVDGQVAGSNTQSSWLGEGWSYSPGFIERTYRPCHDDVENSPVWPTLNNKPDLCWRLANAQIMWNGRASEIVPGDDGVWRLADGDGERVELLTGADNRDNNGEHWRITTADGTQYWFGRHVLPNGKGSTDSTASVPVFANHAGEPCLGATVAASRCQQVYRWMLDYVVDRHGNEMSLWYGSASNRVAINGGSTSAVYERALVLDRIEYGTRVGQPASTPAPARVVFVRDWRCLAASCFTSGGDPVAANWPDTPWDLDCPTAPCVNNVTPSFWSTRLLAGVRTQVRVGGGYQTVDEWTLGHQFPNPGDGSSPSLWLASITRTGKAGGEVAVPAVLTFGTAMQNRADYDPGATMASHRKFRLTRLRTESGGEVEVVYAGPHHGCQFGGGFPNPEANWRRCFPQWYTNPSGQSGWSWWHKLPVTRVVEHDLVGGSPSVEHGYSYSTAASSTAVLWSHTDGAAVWASSLPFRSWSHWRGYSNVTVVSGPAGGPRSRSEFLYLRGLDGDLVDTGTGASRSVTVTDWDGQQWTDSPGWAGHRLQTRTFEQDGGVPVVMTRAEPFEHVTGTRTLSTDWAVPNVHRSYLTRTAATARWEWVDGAWSQRRVVENEWQTPTGLLASTSDSGADIATAADDTCVRYAYVPSAHDTLLRFDGQAAGGGFTAQAAAAVGAGWAGYNVIGGAGDVNSDGDGDVFARSASGRLYLHHGDGAGGLGAGVLVSPGWASLQVLFSPGDFNNDGNPDLLARRPDGVLVRYMGNGADGFAGPTSIGGGWQAFDRLTGVGDLDGDGNVDIAARKPDGQLLIYRGNGSTGFFAPSSAGTGWEQYDQLFSPGDVDGDGQPDLVGRDWLTGVLWAHRGNGAGSGWFHPTPVQAGDPPVSAGAVVMFSPGDMGGDGVPELLTRGQYLIDRIAGKQATAGDCGTTPTLPDDLLSEVRYSYDGVLGLRPGWGNPTTTETLSEHGWVVTGQAGYDHRGRVVSVRDGLGRMTATGYTDTPGGLTEQVTVTNPAGHTTHADLDVHRGLPVAITDPNSHVTTGSYDPLGRLTAITRPGNSTGTPDVEYTYVLQQQAPSYVETKTLGPDGQQITSYDIVDGLLRPRQQQTTAPDGNRTITDTRYDARGLVGAESVLYNNASPPTPDLVAFNDADIESQTRYVYDGRGRVTSTQLWSHDVLQHSASMVYEWDRVASIPPDGGTITQDITNDLGQVVAKRQYLGSDLQSSFQTTSYGYSLRGELVDVTDPAGNQWAYSYDLLGRKVETVDPDAGTSSFTYDDAGQLTTATDGRGQTLHHTYDLLGRTTALREDGPTGPLRAEWVYDTNQLAQLDTAIRHHNGQQYTTSIPTRDQAYRPLQVDVTIPAAEGPLAGTYTFAYTYHPNGAPDTTTLPAAGGLPAETITHGYSSVGLPDTLTSTLGTYIAGTTYRYTGQLAQQLLGQAGTQLQSTYTYEQATGRLATSTVGTENQTTPGTFDTTTNDSYTYDPAGNLLSVTDQTTGQAQCYEYDQLRRLTQAWTTTTACTTTPASGIVDGPDPYWHTWTFDQIGNRLTQTVHPTAAGGDQATTSYTYPTGGTPQPHTLTSKSVTDPAGTVVTGYSYDPAGNTTTRPDGAGGQQTLTWDPEGHLATVTDTTGTADYLYDPDGNRLITHHPDGSATLYLPEAMEIVADPAGITTCRRYYADIAVRTTTSGLTWLATDHHGTGTRAIDADTLQVTTRRLDPYGNPRGSVTGGLWPDDKTFLGKPQDPTGLTHLGAREYDPTIGRFVSLDPLMDLADPQQMHGYTYANNNPTTWSDPTGLCAPDGINFCPGYPIENQPVTGGSGGSSGGGSSGGSACQPHHPCANPGAPGQAVTGQPPPPIVEETLPGGAEYTLGNDGTLTINGWVIPPGGPPSAELAALVDMVMRENGLNPDDVYLAISWLCDDWTIRCSVDFFNAVYQADIVQRLGVNNFGEAAVILTGMSLATNVQGGPGARINGQRGHCSFSGDTHVLMADGTTKPLTEIQPGDQVLATDPETGETSTETVTAVWIHTDTLIQLEITVDDGSSGRTARTALVSTTADHPFWNHTDQQWQPASALDPGDELLAANGGTPTVAGLLDNTRRSADAYNITVTNLHTYYASIGDAAVLVHNRGSGERTISGTIARGSHGMTIQIYANDHGPPHAHLKGQGFDIQIGQNGKPVDPNVQLSGQQQQFVDDNRKTLRSSLRAKMREFNRTRGGCK